MNVFTYYYYDFLNWYKKLNTNKKLLQELQKGQLIIMATLTELVTVVQEVAASIAPLESAINALEAAVTEALKNTDLTPEQQAQVDEAFAGVKSVGEGVTKAIADATDGIDEAVS